MTRALIRRSLDRVVSKRKNPKQSKALVVPSKQLLDDLRELIRTVREGDPWGLAFNDNGGKDCGGTDSTTDIS